MAEVETQKFQKNIIVPLLTKNKSHWQNVGRMSDVGVCNSITGAQSPHYVFVSTIWWALGNLLLLVQTKHKNRFGTQIVKNECRQPLSFTSTSEYESESATTLSHCGTVTRTTRVLGPRRKRCDVTPHDDVSFTYIYMYTCIVTFINMYIYSDIYMYVYVCVYIYVYASISHVCAVCFIWYWGMRMGGFN